jgi:hypothetical protein
MQPRDGDRIAPFWFGVDQDGETRHRSLLEQMSELVDGQAGLLDDPAGRAARDDLAGVMGDGDLAWLSRMSIVAVTAGDMVEHPAIFEDHPLGVAGGDTWESRHALRPRVDQLARLYAERVREPAMGRRPDDRRLRDGRLRCQSPPAQCVFLADLSQSL